MSLKNVDFDAAFRRLADQRIEEAMKDGKFDNLPGMGEDLNLDPLPANENARMMWWALKIMKQNDYIPDEVRWRKALDHLRGAIYRAPNEFKLEELVAKANDLIRKLNTLGTNAIDLGVSPIDLEAERADLRGRLERA